MASSFSAQPEAVRRIAYRIGRVIARKTIRADPKLRRLDALGAAAAEHDMATNMVRDLTDEAAAAWDEAVKIKLEMEGVRDDDAA